jgi:hypothetical protein
MASAMWLRVQTDGLPRRLVHLTGTYLSVGSGCGCRVMLHDPKLEDMHCVFRRRGDGAVIVLNYARKAPMRVNGIQMASATLRPGDRVQCGTTQFELVEERAPASPRSQPGAGWAQHLPTLARLASPRWLNS